MSCSQAKCSVMSPNSTLGQRLVKPTRWPRHHGGALGTNASCLLCRTPRRNLLCEPGSHRMRQTGQPASEWRKPCRKRPRPGGPYGTALQLTRSINSEASGTRTLLTRFSFCLQAKLWPFVAFKNSRRIKSHKDFARFFHLYKVSHALPAVHRSSQ